MMASYLHDKGIPIVEIAVKIGVGRTKVYDFLKKADRIRDTWRFKFETRNLGSAKMDKYALLPDEYLVSEKNSDGTVVSFVWSSNRSRYQFLKKQKKAYGLGKQTIQKGQNKESPNQLSPEESIAMCEKAIAPLLDQDTLPVEYKSKELSFEDEQKRTDALWMELFYNHSGGPVIIRIDSMADLSKPEIIEKMKYVKSRGRKYQIGCTLK